MLQEASMLELADLSYGVDMVKFWVEMKDDEYDNSDPFWTSEWTPNTRSWVTKRRGTRFCFSNRRHLHGKG